MPKDEPTHPPIQEFEFPWPNEEKGYALFSKELETDPLVLFHGTQKKNLESIIKEGFKPRPPLTSVSYAKNSVYSLTHVIRQRKPHDVIIVVRFKTLETQGIENNTQDIHVNIPELQPTIIGYCTIPHTYKHE
jgi:RNA:NAD 2'-phosphotransferase (TPT1/KptA family)